MIKIRLRRMGAKKQPSYRVVVADARAPRDGRFIETLGYYNPLTDPATVRIDADRARYWIQHGAKVTPTAAGLLVRSGVAEADAARDRTRGLAAPGGRAAASE